MPDLSSLNKRDPAFIQDVTNSLDWFYKYYFKVQSFGWQNIPSGKVLVIGSHNGGLSTPDMSMFCCDWTKHFGTDRPLYGLMHKSIYDNDPIVAENCLKLGAIEAHPKMAIEAFRNGGSVLLFPGGGKDAYRPFYKWDKVELNENRAFIKLALRLGVPIIPWVSVGAHHTSYVLADYAPIFKELNKVYGNNTFPTDTILPLVLDPSGLSLGINRNLCFPKRISYSIAKPIYLTSKPEPNKRFSSSYVDECFYKVQKVMQDTLDELISNSEYAVNNNFTDNDT